MPEISVSVWNPVKKGPKIFPHKYFVRNAFVRNSLHFTFSNRKRTFHKKTDFFGAKVVVGRKKHGLSEQKTWLSLPKPTFSVRAKFSMVKNYDVSVQTSLDGSSKVLGSATTKAEIFKYVEIK